MLFKRKNCFKSLVWEHGVIKGVFQRKYRFYSLLYLYINLLWVNGVGTVVAKEKKQHYQLGKERYLEDESLR